MSLKDSFEVRETGDKRLDEFRRGVYRYELMESMMLPSGDGRTEDLLPPIMRRYRLSLLLRTDFHATDDTYPRARKNAEQRLYAKIFADFLVLLPESYAAICSGDREAALALNDRMYAIAKGEA